MIRRPWSLALALILGAMDMRALPLPRELKRSSAGGRRTFSKPHCSVPQMRRMARKRRNQLRHKARVQGH